MTGLHPSPSTTGFLCVALALLELTLDQASLELRDLPTSAFLSAGLKVCSTMPGFRINFEFILLIVCMWVHVSKGRGQMTTFRSWLFPSPIGSRD